MRQQLQADFEYNLRLLEERDKELERYEAAFAELRAVVNGLTAEASELKVVRGGGETQPGGEWQTPFSVGAAGRGQFCCVSGEGGPGRAAGAPSWQNGAAEVRAGGIQVSTLTPSHPHTLTHHYSVGHYSTFTS